MVVAAERLWDTNHKNQFRIITRLSSNSTGIVMNGHYPTLSGCQMDRGY